MAELRHVMCEMFLDGLDWEWVDYNSIDRDPRHDDLRQMDQDEEDRYFDE